MANEYTELATLKTYLKIDGDDTRDDDVLELVLETASRQIDQICNRRFYVDAEASARTYHVARDGISVFTDDISATSGLEIRTGVPGSYTTTLTAGTDGELLGGSEGKPYTGFRSWSYLPCSNKPTVQVTAKWGWAAVPVPVQNATLILATHLFERTKTPLGVIGFGEMGGLRLSANDPDVTALLTPYVKVAWA